MRARGFKPSAYEKKRFFSAPHPIVGAAPYPTSAALRPFKPPTMDQGHSSTCGPHSLAALLYTGAAAAGFPLAFVPSPRGIASNTLAKEQPGDGPLADTGVSLADMMLAVELEGIRAIEAPTPDGRFSDIATAEDLAHVPDAPPPNVGLRPTLAEDEKSARLLIIDPAELQAAATDFEAQMASGIGVLKAGINIGIHATPEFEAYGEADQGGHAYDTYDTASFSDADGHAVGLYDYRTELDGSLSFWLGNSWGQWGDEGGGIWVTGRWLRRSTLEAWRVGIARGNVARASVGQMRRAGGAR